MRLPCRAERLLDADVELAVPGEREPDASAGAQRFGLLELPQPEQVAEEAARLRLAARWSRDLDVV
jgi:hypothetical protein